MFVNYNCHCEERSNRFLIYEITSTQAYRNDDSIAGSKLQLI